MRTTVAKPRNVKQFLDEQVTTAEFAVVKSTIVNFREYYAAVKQIATGKVFAVVFLIEYDRNTMTWRELTETHGPNAANAPQTILDLLTESDNDFANKWREKCAENIAETKRRVDAKLGLTSGQKVEVYGKEYIVNVEGRRVFLYRGNSRYRLSKGTPFKVVG